MEEINIFHAAEEKPAAYGVSFQQCAHPLERTAGLVYDRVAVWFVLPPYSQRPGSLSTSAYRVSFPPTGRGRGVAFKKDI